MKISYDYIEKKYNNKIEDIAKDLTITKEYWYMIRKGKRRPSSDKIYKLSNRLGIEFRQLYIFFNKNINKKLD